MLTWLMYDDPIQSDTLLCYLTDRFDIAQAGFATLADGGFGEGQLGLQDVPDAVMDDINDNWLGRRVTAVDGAGNICYEGYVTELEYGRGQHAFRRSLDSFFNEVRVTYIWDSNGNTKTKTADDTASQARYGVKHIEVDVTAQGKMSDAQAAGLAQVYLNRYTALKQHRTAIASGMSAIEDGNVSLTLWGYLSTLKWMGKASTGWPSSTDIGQIVSDVLTNTYAVGLNQFISTDMEFIETTGNTIKYTPTGFTYADRIISDVVAYGDSNQLRLLFQVWGDRLARLISRPTTAAYYTTSQLVRVRDAGRAPIPPWTVRAGQYMVFEDLPVPHDSYATDIDLDPRAILIEQTHWDDVGETLTIDPTNIEVVRIPPPKRPKKKYHARHPLLTFTPSSGGGGGGGSGTSGRRYGRQHGARHQHPRRRK